MAELQTKPVEYLAVSEGLLGHPTTGEPVIILTIRPDPPSFLVVNLALPIDQAWRLARDIENLLIPFALLLVILLTTGCRVRANVESAKWASSSGERMRTAVEADLLRPQRPEQVGETKATEPQPQAAPADEKPVIGSGDTTIIVNFRGGDTHYETHTHVHVHEAAVPRVDERATARREVQVEPRRSVDERCEQLAREHEQRVEMWKRFPFGQ
ncbi:MAG: hypothetical protein ACYC0X_23435 [Pirellulaceae bacterium]